MLASARKERAPSAAASTDEEAGPSSGVYRPPRVAAVPYSESSRAAGKRRTERKAPALLSEFASQMDSAPALESTSGLATRPAAALGHTNSVSSTRAKELARMTEFEEENMTRLVTTKAEARRRIEDEESLALGFGVGGGKRSRQRRQGGLEAEMEGVLGDRGGRDMWDGVGRGLGKREGLLERSRKRGVERGDEGFGSEGPAKKGKFQKDLKRAKKGGKR
jgi:U3 small nucleolar ribonucleoprotein protein LCP5